MKILLIGIGGFIGSVGRYYVTKWINLFFPSKIPFGTIAVNVIGSFLIGFLMILAIEKLVVSEDARLFIGVGLIGGFTTFSTFAFETLFLFEEGFIVSSFIYLAGNIILGFLAAYAGMLLARHAA